MATVLKDQNGDQTGAAGSRLSRPRWIARLCAWLLLVAGCYALFIEPYWIQVTYSDMHGDVAAPLKIAHLSDLHTVGIGRRERQLLRILDEEKPDVIVITGDSIGQWIGAYGHNGDYAQARKLYQKLHAPLGVWFARGNWENAKPVANEQSFYQSAGVHLLLNSGAALRSDVWIAGLDDPRSGNPNVASALAGAPPGAYTILLFHSPGYFGRVEGRVKLCLTGHTHGGQVRLPFVKPFWLPGGSWPYVEGWYEGKGSKMYVSRGLGTSILPIRFLCRPEVSFITIHPGESFDNEPAAQ
jgi:uncharacterized protein